MKYCENPYYTIRRKTHEVRVGHVGIGGGNPVRVQSMTNTNTMDTEATVKQVIELSESGCEIVRITAPSNRDAENLKNIKSRLLAENIKIPLVADIHFTPNAAMIAAEYVEKIRVNPGNFAEKGGKTGEISDKEYQEELERIEEKFRPLVLKCKERGIAMRIGTNHGSLSERILSRFGDTPQGMVESAMEFVYFAEAQNYNQIVLSMKASNPLVMIEAYRLLAARLYNENRTYPLHLGVTEAGGGMEGRIKSASGIYSLLQDGIGDTIRVSLTESPVAEIPVAQRLVTLSDVIDPPQTHIVNNNNPPFYEYAFLEPDKKRASKSFAPITSQNVLVTYRLKSLTEEDTFDEFLSLDRLEENRRPDLIWMNSEQKNWIDDGHFQRYNFGILDRLEALSNDYTAFSIDLERIEPDRLDSIKNQFIEIRFDISMRSAETADSFKKRIEEKLKSIRDIQNNLPNIFLEINGPYTHGDVRLFFEIYHQLAMNIPVILGYYSALAEDELLIHCPGLLGGLLMDGFGDGIQLNVNTTAQKNMDIAFNLLQAARLRITQTEFISCPSCGRTLFDLEETTGMIKSATGHLKGLKIAVMGCIVNGPGEMADADFGYVGAGKGRINLYVGHEVVKKNIPTAEATGELIDLIKLHGKWVDPLD